MKATSATAFALIGDRFHNSDYIRSGLGRVHDDNVDLGIRFSDEVELLNADTLSRHDLLIIFRDGMRWPQGYGSTAPYPGYDPAVQGTVSDPAVPELEAGPVQWITDEQGKAVRSFVEAGGACLFYHNSTYITASADYTHVHGSITAGHPPVRPYRVRITDREHPVTRGVKDFVVTDEQHYMQYQKEPENVLAVSINENGLDFNGIGTQCEAAWAYDYGAGRVCYLAPGHTIPALWNPEYVKLQRNAIRWLLRQP